MCAGRNGGNFMATKKKDDDIVKEVVEKPKMKPRGKNIGETLAPVTEPGDNAKYIGVSLQLFNLPKVDLRKPEDVQARLSEYFQIRIDADLKPTVAGMAMALGIDRRRLWEIKSGAKMGGTTEYDLPTPTLVAIKKAYDFLENLWENYMNNGKINPVSGIFLAKNNFGYQDKTEYVVTPNVNNDSDYSAEDIRKRYLTDSPTIEQLPDSTDSDS
jgi:hypothetical protein